ncbi:MAG: hypothetical protein HQM08_15945 [Candidatus Riflebacteria bacterium]|nr:hypothetical protein [Candidatus Riflebacteria bacterium]
MGGLFIWLSLPDGLSSEKLLPIAIEEGVDFSPGSNFFPGVSNGNTNLRLNFAIELPEMIEEGIKRLGRAIKRLSF